MEIRPYVRTAFFYETDAMGCVHHSNFIRWFEEARMHYMDKMGFGYKQTVDSNIDLALTGIACEYKGMVYFNDTVEIVITLPKITPSRLTCGYTVTDTATRQLCATGETHHCYFHKKRQRPVSLKKELPELFEIFSAFGRENSGT